MRRKKTSIKSSKTASLQRSSAWESPRHRVRASLATHTLRALIYRNQCSEITTRWIQAITATAISVPTVRTTLTRKERGSSEPEVQPMRKITIRHSYTEALIYRYRTRQPQLVTIYSKTRKPTMEVKCMHQASAGHPRCQLELTKSWLTNSCSSSSLNTSKQS